MNLLLSAGSLTHLHNFSPLSASPFFLIIRTMVMPTVYRLGLGTSRLLRLFVLLLGVPYKRLRLLRQKIDIMHETSVGIFNAKKKAIEEGVDGDHKDFLSILSCV